MFPLMLRWDNPLPRAVLHAFSFADIAHFSKTTSVSRAEHVGQMDTYASLLTKRFGKPRA